jgi:uncharacterized protein involved in exopolysaccharide biosynthesis
MSADRLGAQPQADATQSESPDTSSSPSARLRSLSRRAAIVVAAAVAAGILTYVISNTVTPTFTSSAELRIVVGGTSGLGEDSVVASNDLTAQLVPLVSTNKVLDAPASSLGLSPSALKSVVSAGSVAQQNLLQISANASSAAESERIARTVTTYFISFETSNSRTLASASSAILSKSIRSLDARLTQIAGQLRTATGSQSALLQSEYDSTLTQSQALGTQSAELDAAGVPVIELLQSAGSGSEVAPRPKLYAIVAALVAAFCVTQLFVLTDRRRRSSASDSFTATAG